MEAPSVDVSLRPFDVALCATVASWVTSREEQFRWTAHTFSFPLTSGALEVFMREPASSTRRFSAHLSPGGGPVAFLELNQLDPANRSARLGRVLVAPQFRGTGVGTLAVRAAVTESSDVLGVHRLDLLVATDNTAAISCYLRAGFTHEGTARGARLFDGRFRDMATMAVVRGN